MDRVVLRGYNPRVLQNQLHSLVVLKPVNFCSIIRRQTRRRSSGIVENVRRFPRKIGGENSLGLEKMRLKKSRCWHDKSDIVDAGNGSASVAGFAGRARVDPKADGEQQVVINRQGNVGREFFGIEAFEGVDELVGHLCGILRRGDGQGCRGVGQGSGVVNSGGGGGIVDGDRGVHERGGGDQVLAGVLIGGDQGVGGLAWGDDDGVDGEGLDVSGVDFDDGELVAGDLEEEFFIEGSVDYAEEVGLAGLNTQCEAAYMYQV